MVKKTKTEIGILFLCITLGACMQPPPTETPTRVSITDSEGTDQTSITLASGMTHKLYSGVYVADLVGERYVGVAEGKDFLSDNVFEVVKNDPTSDSTVIDLKPNGCVVAKKKGTAKVRFSAFSLKTGMLKAISSIQVKDVLPQNVDLKTGVTDFSVSELKDATGAKYGVAVDNKFFLMSDSTPQALVDTQGVAIESSGLARLPFIWTDSLQGGFFIGYGKSVSGKDRLTYAMVDNKGVRIPSHFSAPTDLEMKRVYGGQIRNSIPVTIALSKETDKDIVKLFMFIGNMSSSGNNSGFIADQGKNLELPLIDEVDIDRVVQFSKDPFGGMYVMTGAFINHPDATDVTKTETVNQLKMMMYGEGGLKVETPPGMTVDNPKAFAFDTLGESQKVIFIQNKSLLFSQRLGGWVLSFGLVDSDVDETFSPRLLSNTEDGTLIAAWRKGGTLKVRVSSDGGGTWSDAFSLANVVVDDVELIPLPCGGTGLLTKEAGALNLRFIDSTQKQFSNPQALSTTAVKKIKIFRHGQNVRFFYLDVNGGLHFVKM